MPLRLNPGLKFFPFYGGEAPSLLCEIATTDSARPLRYAVPETVARFLQAFDGKTETDAVVRACLDGEWANGWTQSQLTHFVQGYCVPKGLLVNADDPMVVREPTRNRADYMSIAVPLLPAALIARLTTALQWLYRPWVMRTAVTCSLILIGVFFFILLPSLRVELHRVKGLEFLAVLLLLSAVSLIHEIGHATALAYCGHRSGFIGWGLYLFFPVLYTDLSNAWRLTRAQRVLVNLGGIYFEGLVLAGLIVARFSGLHGSILLYLILAIVFQLASSLNPFFRMDGYWLTADLLGIPNLQVKSRRAVLGVLGPVAGRNDDRTPKRLRAAVRLYTALSIGCFLLIYQFFLRQLIGSVLPHYPETVREAIRCWTEHPLSAVRIVDAMVSVVWKGIALLGVVLLVVRLARRAIEFANRRWAWS